MKRAATMLLLMLTAACSEFSAPPVEPDVLVQASVTGAVLHVPRDYPTIQAAVDAAPAGAIIQVRAGIYPEQVTVTKSGLKLRGGPDTVLDGATVPHTTVFGNIVGSLGFYVPRVGEAPLHGIEISGFEVRNYVWAVYLENVDGARVHRNVVHHNARHGIWFEGAHAAEIIGNTVHDNGLIGIQPRGLSMSRVQSNESRNNGWRGISIGPGPGDNVIRANVALDNGSEGIYVLANPRNVIQANRAHGNGWNTGANTNGAGIVVTGEGAHGNRVVENETTGNHGWGIQVARASGTAPITGNIIAQNRSHHNQRSGIMLGGAVRDNVVQQNDARSNNLSGLAPCFRCNLMEMSTAGTNTWVRNLGTFNLVDACAP